MRVLIIQENGRHEKNRNFRECFSMQRALEFFDNDVDVWGLGHLNFDSNIDFESYDMILNLENYDDFGWVPDLSKVDTKKLIWCVDPHIKGIDPYIEEYKRGNYNLILQAIPKYVVDKTSVWFPTCYDGDLVYPFDIEKKHFIGFCGSLLNRKQILDSLTDKYGLIQDIWVLGEDMVKAISSYSIHFNMSLADDVNYRSFETLGCGTLLLTNKNPQHEALGFVDGKNCLIYDSYETLCNKIELCVNDPSIIDDIVDNGFDLADKHTYVRRADTLLKIYRNL